MPPPGSAGFASEHLYPKGSASPQTIASISSSAAAAGVYNKPLSGPKPSTDEELLKALFPMAPMK